MGHSYVKISFVANLTFKFKCASFSLLANPSGKG